MKVRVLIRSVLVIVYDVPETDPDEAVDHARRLAERAIDNGSLVGWDMTLDTKVVQAEPDNH